METQFNNSWNLWYHHNRNNWKKTSFKKIYTINNINDFWILFNNWNEIGGLLKHHFFLMRDGVLPLWEDINNKNGGCWSYKKKNTEIEELWEQMAVYIVGETLSKNELDINGISISIKNNGYSVIKIWNKECKNNSLTNINSDLLKKWGTDLIYIANITDK